ncbi:MAG: M48 family metalloprotease [Balneolaceae bacterium]
MKRITKRIPVFIAVLVFASGCVVQQNPVSGNKRAYAYSWEQEVQIGQEVDQEISSQFGIYEESGLDGYIIQLGEDILQESHMRREDTPEEFRNTEFTFRVLNSPVVNAFALPGGYVYVTRGLLAHLNNEAQLAVVIGHEIGHVAARHASQRAFQQNLGQIAVIGGSILGQELLGLPGETLLNISSQAAQLLFLSYSRDHERESDRLGVEYSAMTGYDAAEGAEFFTSLKRISEQSGQAIPSLLSSHPDPGERESSIPEMAAEWREQGYEQQERNTEQYMQEIQGIIYGENPREGFVDDGSFVHPELEFSFPVPENWHLINQPSQVALVSPNEDAVMLFRIDSEAGSARQSVENFVSQEGIQVESTSDERSSGEWPAYEAIVTAETDQQTLGMQVFAVEYDGNIYQFVNYSSVNDFESFIDDFSQTSSNFDELTDRRLLDIEPVRLEVVTADQNQIFQNLLPSPLPMDIDPEDIAILNQVALDEEIEAGTLIKIPVQ